MFGLVCLLWCAISLVWFACFGVGLVWFGLVESIKCLCFSISAVQGKCLVWFGCFGEDLVWFCVEYKVSKVNVWFGLVFVWFGFSLVRVFVWFGFSLVWVGLVWCWWIWFGWFGLLLLILHYMNLRFNNFEV